MIFSGEVKIQQILGHYFRTVRELFLRRWFVAEKTRGQTHSWEYFDLL
jgi:hypothetical protein